MALVNNSMALVASNSHYEEKLRYAPSFRQGFALGYCGPNQNS